MDQILIIAGSDGKNLELANEYKNVIEELGRKCHVVDLVSLHLPMYSSKQEKVGPNQDVLKLVNVCEKAKGFIFTAPEYNGGIPPVVTNAISWISRSGNKDWRSCFNGKPAVIGTWSGGGGVNILNALRLQLSFIGLNVLGRQTKLTMKESIDRHSLKAIAKDLLKLCNV